MTTTASVNDVRKAIDSALTSTGYSCKVVSWDDVSRGTVNGSLSCWGSNITDTRLSAKDGTPLFTVRSDNWNEKLGAIEASHLALLVGNCDEKSTLRNVTLADFLRAPCENGARYSGLKESTSLAAKSDTKVSIRFQTVFLPVAVDPITGRGSLQFATEAYNYATRSDDDPRNIVLLATTQGLSLQADGAGNKRLFHHKRMEGGKVGEYWLEAESTRHKVGGEQKETKEERTDALARGKATSEVIGIRAMGKRFNVLMTVQVPLKQQERKLEQTSFAIPTFGMSFCAAPPAPKAPPVAKCSAPPFGLGRGAHVRYKRAAPPAPKARPVAKCSAPPFGLGRGAHVRYKRRSKPGVSSAARVSRGDHHGPYSELKAKGPVRSEEEHVTVTCVLYNAVAGGVPTPDDCVAAVEDMEGLYASCSDDGRLADAAFDFMKKELTVGDMVEIQDKLTTQPPGPPISKPPVTTPSDLLRAKLSYMEDTDMDAKNVHSLKLLTLGVVQDKDTKALLVELFDKLSGALGSPEQARALFIELKMTIDGMLSLEDQ